MLRQAGGQPRRHYARWQQQCKQHSAGGERQEAHVSKVTIQDLDKMVNLLQPEQLIVRVINPDDEEERRVPVCACLADQKKTARVSLLVDERARATDLL